MGLIEDFGRGAVALDAAIFIYFIEQHPRFLPLVRPIFSQIAEGRREAVTSGVTLLETLVAPYRAGNAPLADRYEELLTRSRGLRLVAIDGGQLRAAAQLRAAYALKTPDALQLAAALTMRCGAFVTNDRAFPVNVGVRVLQLSTYL